MPNYFLMILWWLSDDSLKTLMTLGWLSDDSWTRYILHIITFFPIHSRGILQIRKRFWPGTLFKGVHYLREDINQGNTVHAFLMFDIHEKYRFLNQVKVRYIHKQIMVFSILPKNEQNSLSLVKKKLRIVSFIHFFRELRAP